jgi:hypothetical protein
MAATTNSLIAGSLKRHYPKQFFKVLENEELTLLNLCDALEDWKAIGDATYFPFYISTPKNISASSTGDTTIRAAAQRQEVQGSVTPVEIVGNFEISDYTKNTATAAGSFNGGELARETEETSQGLAKMINRYLASSHGTGRLAMVDASTVASTSFVAAVTEARPYGVSNLMVGDVIDIYDTDSAGAAQYSAVTITNIDRSTRTVTTGTSMTLTAGWSIYRAGAYGLSINGLRNLIDNGTAAATIHGQIRATYNALNAVYLNIYSGGVATDLTEEQVRQTLNQVHANGGRPDTAVCNPGVADAYLRINATLRQYIVPNGDLFESKVGTPNKMSVGFRDLNLSVVREVNALPRAFYMLRKGDLKKVIARDMGWYDEDGEMVRMSIASGAYKTSWSAAMGWLGNICNPSPNFQGIVIGAKDSFNGDSVS